MGKATVCRALARIAAILLVPSTQSRRPPGCRAGTAGLGPAHLPNPAATAAL